MECDMAGKMLFIVKKQIHIITSADFILLISYSAKDLIPCSGANHIQGGYCLN